MHAMITLRAANENERSAITPRPPLRRHARTAVCCGLVLFALIQLGLSVAMDCWLPVLHDPEYGHKLARLRARLAEQPDRPLVLVLGSSRSGIGLSPAAFPPLAVDGRPALVFNFAITGCGPVQELQTLKRLLRHGVRPQRLLIEVHPLLLHQDRGVGEQNWLDPRRLDLADLPTVARYVADPWALCRQWCRLRLAPCYANRFLIFDRFARTWLEAQHHQDAWTGLTDDGWLPYGRQEISADEYRRGVEHARREYGPMLDGYRVTAPADAALVAMLNLCRDEQIETALFLMPEGSEFRGWYSAAARRQIDEYLSRLQRHFDVRVYDATTWCPDGDFWDSHHLLAAGARRFSERFGREAVGNFLAERAGAPAVRVSRRP